LSATAAGTQPPWNSLLTLATKKPKSRIRNGTMIAATCHTRHFHTRSITSARRFAVTSITPLTAIP